MLMDPAYPSDSSPHIMTSPVAQGNRKTSGDTESPVAGTFIDVPGEFDVMMGRGIGPNEHPGNKRYRNIVHSYQPDYLATKKRKEKEKIARKAIRSVKANGARFIKQVEGEHVTNPDGDQGETKTKKKQAKRWVVVEKDTVLEKTKQALRFVGHYKSSKKTGGGSSSEGEESSEGGASPAKVLRPTMDSKGQEYATSYMSQSGAHSAMLPARGGVRQEQSPQIASVDSRPPSQHHLLPSAGGNPALSALLSRHAGDPQASQLSALSLFRQQQLAQEIVAGQEEQLRRAVAAGLAGTRRAGSSSPPLATRPSPLVGLGPAAYGGIGDSLAHDELSRIALLLQHNQRSQREADLGDPTRSLLLQPLAYAQPNLSPMERLLLGLPSSSSLLGGTGMGDASLAQGGQSAPSSLNRAADATNMLRSLLLPASRESLSGHRPAGGDSQRSEGSSRLSSSSQGRGQTAELPAALTNQALLSLLLLQTQQQQHTMTSDRTGGTTAPSADYLRALAAHYRQVDEQSPPDRRSRSNDGGDGDV